MTGMHRSYISRKIFDKMLYTNIPFSFVGWLLEAWPAIYWNVVHKQLVVFLQIGTLFQAGII